ncbi:MAG: MBL fold metallo-hydrolase [Ferruginibacter sp.]|nr:MBL fold metallo-hydrolase [Ferruginibacter sp.]
MSLFICSLNSGSNGNCYYVGNDTEAVLVDVGISCREVEKRMAKVGLFIKKVKAIFISHEHGDHIKGVTTLANKYNLPVYITTATAQYGPRLISHLAKPFAAEETIDIGGLSIIPFKKYHDGIDPHSFIIKHNDTTVGVFTDIGKVCQKTIEYFAQCHAVFLETNYDEEMLENGRYPTHLKNRIRGGEGHLSNREALELVKKYNAEKLSHLLLSHLSKENNDEELVKNLFTNETENIKITVASRYEATAVYSIGEKIIANTKQQLALF